MLWDSLILFVASLVANTFSAFAGGGAGLLQLPILIFTMFGIQVLEIPDKWRLRTITRVW